MPELDGYGVCKALKSDAGDRPHAGAHLLARSARPHDLERGFDAGADDYLVKPVVPEELLDPGRAARCRARMPASRERILVVDDSPALRHYVADCLARQGFEVATAENGRIGAGEGAGAQARA